MKDPASATKYDLPPLPWLRAFEAAARHTSFTSAALELNLTQAAVSHQVRCLEKHLGVALFERLPRKLRLTEIGSAYLPPVRQSFDELAAATAGLFGPIGRRTLAVRAPVSFLSIWLAPRLSRFCALYPQVGIRLTSAVWAYAAVDEMTDVDIRFGDGSWPGYRAELIDASDAIPVCRADLLPAGTPAERLAAVAAGRLIHVTGYEDQWQRLFAPHGIATEPFRDLNVDTSIAALELAAGGYGAAVVLRIFADRYIADGRLVPIVADSVSVRQSHYVLVAEGSVRQPPEVMLFRSWLMDEARRDRGESGPLPGL